MNTNPLVRHYGNLSPEERFRLAVAARARGDEAEQGRLLKAGERITLRMADSAPWSHAFNELATVVFIEMLDEAANYDDAAHRLFDVECFDGEDDPEADDSESESEPIEAQSAGEDTTESNGAGERTITDRLSDLYLAQGFLLKAKADGWKLFCERLTVPPFAVWMFLPGFERFRRTLEETEDNEYRPGAAFRPEGMLRFLRCIRPESELEPTLDNLISAECTAAELDRRFRQLVEQWGG